MTGKEVIRVKVYRSPSPEQQDGEGEGGYKEYEVPYEERMTILNVLDCILEGHDRSLAYYKSCRIGRCSGCLVEVDGKNTFSCSTLAQNGMKIGPAKGRKIIRDLVVNLSR